MLTFSGETATMRSAGMFVATLLTAVVDASHESALVQLIEQGKIALSPIGIGGHSGECVRVNVANLTNGSLSTRLPAGWVFVSENEGVQDLIVVRTETIALGPGSNHNVTCRAFCCEAAQAGPGLDEPFRKGHPARADLFALAQAVDSGSYSDDLVQNAVWVLSDGNDIGSMGAMDGSPNDRLRERVSRLSNQALPLYTLRYAPAGDRACSQRPASISRTITFHNGTAQEITVVARKDDGTIKEILLNAQSLPAGTVDVPLHVNVADWPHGRYAFHVHSKGSSTVRRLPFTL